MNYYNSLPVVMKQFGRNMNFDEGSGTSITNSANIGGYDGTLHSTTFISLSDPIADTDGDGINDEDDYFPEDANKAYNSIYPSGNKYYYHLYEDLWPSLAIMISMILC